MRFISAFLMVGALLLAAPAVVFAEEWHSVTDEIEIDYETATVRVFALSKGNSGPELKDAARKPLLAYIGTLTSGEKETPLVQVFKTRPVLQAKVQEIVVQNLDSKYATFLPELQQYSCYHFFDLKRLKQAVPDLNMPRPSGAVQ